MSVKGNTLLADARAAREHAAVLVQRAQLTAGSLVGLVPDEPRPDRTVERVWRSVGARLGDKVLATMPQPRTALEQTVAERFGVLPAFFVAPVEAAAVVEKLWGFACSSYLDNPLPSLFKERLFVHLSRFCAVRYCIVRHAGFLLGLGHASGDATVAPLSVVEMLALLRRPPADGRRFDEALQRLEDEPELEALPAAQTAGERDLFDALTLLFLDPVTGADARRSVRHALGTERFELVVAFLAFVRTAHYWTETHPELGYEPDVADLLTTFPELGRLLLDETEAHAARSRLAARTRIDELRLRAEAAMQP